LACLVFWGFLAETGLTGVLHRSDWCGAFLWKLPSFTSRDRSDRWCSPVWPVLVSGLEVWCSAAFSGQKGCVLVLRSSGTLVATWAWPTWVVSRRRVLEAVFTLLKFPSPSRRIFIGSHSLPPLWFAVSVLQGEFWWQHSLCYGCNNCKLDDRCTNETYDWVSVQRGYFVQQWSGAHVNSHVVVHRLWCTCRWAHDACAYEHMVHLPCCIVRNAHVYGIWCSWCLLEWLVYPCS
jgi:hypothetical protein